MSPTASIPVTDAVRFAHASGRVAYGDLGLPVEAFEARVLSLAARHWRGLGLEPTPDRVAEMVGAAALADVYLASACEAGGEAAWRTLSERFARRLEGFAVRRGKSSAEAESLVEDLLGDLAMPPPRGDARTLIGTFDGTGSLFGWLSVVLLRRIAGQARARAPRSLEAADPETLDGAAPVGLGTSAPTPVEGSADDETVRRFDGALDAAWACLTRQERLALLLKHRDGLTQRKVGEALGVGEARTSRIVSAGVERLGQAVRQRLGPDGVPDGEALAARLADSLRRHLARVGGRDAPTSDGTAGWDPPGPARPQDTP